MQTQFERSIRYWTAMVEVVRQMFPSQGKHGVRPSDTMLKLDGFKAWANSPDASRVFELFIAEDPWLKSVLADVRKAFK